MMIKISDSDREMLDDYFKSKEGTPLESKIKMLKKMGASEKEIQEDFVEPLIEMVKTVTR